MELTIAGFAKEGGVGVETVRYYQRRGLLTSPVKHSVSGGICRYGIEDVRRLRFIRSAQIAGFTLAEISELLELDASKDRARARALAEARVALLDQQINALQTARHALAELARACRSGEGESCPIIHSFEITAPCHE